MRGGHKGHSQRWFCDIWVIDDSLPCELILATKATKAALKKHWGSGKALALFWDLEIMVGMAKCPRTVLSTATEQEVWTSSKQGPKVHKTKDMGETRAELSTEPVLDERMLVLKSQGPQRQEGEKKPMS